VLEELGQIQEVRAMELVPDQSRLTEVDVFKARGGKDPFRA
jgi:hypothetical protein